MDPMWIGRSTVTYCPAWNHNIITENPATLTIPAVEAQVSILGEKLMVERADGRANYTSIGRPIAIISNITVTYTPGPPPTPAAAPRVPPPATRKPATRR